MRAKVRIHHISVLFAVALLSGCATSQRDIITQFSTIDALLAGAYDGTITCRQLSKYGDFGIGTFDKLDGEMILSDGELYQVHVDGSVSRPSPDLTTPFAVVSRFSPDQTRDVNQLLSLPAMESLVNQAEPNRNVFCAVRIQGTFERIKTRSVPPQEKPYPPLAEAIKQQRIFNMENVRGTIVGYRCPPFVKGINVPDFHLHFISEDGTQGGHILDFTLTRGILQLDLCSKLVLILPECGKGLQHLDLTPDRSHELQRVEKLK